MAQIVKQEASWLGRLREGSFVEVTLLKKLHRRAYFDLGAFGTGIVYGAEHANARDILKGLEPGDRVHAKIEAVEGEEGCVELSLAEADKQRLWQQAQELMESGEVVKVKATEVNSGGIIVDLLGLKGFLPVSHLSQEHFPRGAEIDRQRNREDLKKLIGEEFNTKVITVNPRANKLIVSEREVLSANLKEALTRYEVGQVVEGVVSGAADFGVFVRFADNPQIEGLVHISEIDHRLIENPKEVVRVGESVQVKIIEIRDGRVFLSMKALRPDPWDRVPEQYQLGQEVRGSPYKFNPFGAVINLEDGLQGMVHVSEFGSVEEMRKVLLPGQSYCFTIEAIRPEEKRIILRVKK